MVEENKDKNLEPEVRDDAGLIAPEESMIPIGPRFLTEPIWTEIVDFDNDSPVALIDGKLHINKKRYEDEQKSVKDALAAAIESGDEETFNKLTDGLSESEEEYYSELYPKLREAVEKRTQNPFELQAINVDLLTNGVAERNLIREGLKPQIAKQPFTFKDGSGRVLDFEKDIDFVFTKGTRNSYKIVVASKKGISEIEIPEELSDDKFAPDYNNIDRDNGNDSIIIPLKASKDGNEPLAGIFEIRKGPLDLIAILKKQESDAVSEREQREERDRQQRAAQSAAARPTSPPPFPSQPSYSPPPPQAPSRSSEGGGYGYTSGSR